MAGDFFSSSRDVDHGLSRAEAPLKGLRELNNNVKVWAHSIGDGNPEACATQEPSSFFHTFDFVIYFEGILQQATHINAKCRSLVNTPPTSSSYPRFSYVVTNGTDSLWIQDANTVKWTPKVSEKEGHNTNSESSAVEQSIEMKPFDKFLPQLFVGGETASVVRSLQNPQSTTLIDLLLGLWVNSLCKTRGSVPRNRRLGMRKTLTLLLANSSLGDCMTEEVVELTKLRGVTWAGTSSVVGGVIAQELLKMLSGRHKPVVNMLLFSQDRSLTLDLTSLPTAEMDEMQMYLREK